MSTRQQLTAVTLCLILVAPFALQASVCFGQGAFYSFAGNVSSLYYDGGGILAAHSVAIGDPVTVSYLVDFEATGFYLLNDGSTHVPADPPLGNVHTTYFYSRLASGTLLPEANGGLNNDPQDVAEYFTGWNQSSPLGNEGLLQGGMGDSYFSVSTSSFSTGSRVQEWQLGTEVRGVLVAYSDRDWSIAWADMRLESITAVPEPGTVATAIASLAVVAACCRWCKRRARSAICHLSNQPIPDGQLAL